MDSTTTPPVDTATSRRDTGIIVATVAIWVALSATAIIGLLVTSGPVSPVSAAVMIVIGLLLGTVWIGGLRTLGILAVYPFLTRRNARSAPMTDAASVTGAVGGADPASTAHHSVALLYCTANDFDASSLAASMRQTHQRVDTFILDDSSEASVRARIDDFARASGAHVVRRTERSGYKAGNLNHFFATTRPRHDAFVILDSDEVLQTDFVEAALARLAQASVTARVGVVQGRHRTRRGRSRFADEFGPMFETHVAVTQLVRSTYGFSFFMGRGALITAECVEAVGGFPELVMEDLAFSLEAQEAGYAIVYDPDLVSCEDYPVDYHAFRKQHGKFIEGATEFLAQRTGRIIRARLRAAQKVDLLLETVTAPLGAVVAIGMFLLGLLPLGAGNAPLMPPWMGAALAVCGVAPLLGEVCRRLIGGRPLSAGLFVFRALALFASTLWITIRSVARVTFGARAVFAVTPKRRSDRHVLVVAGAETAVALGALLVSVQLAHSFAPAMAFVLCAAAAWYLGLLSRARSNHPELASPTRSDQALVLAA